jgi:hypothetical protein
MANEIVPYEMSTALNGIAKVCEKIRWMLTRYDITTVQEPVRADIQSLRELVEQLDQAFQKAKDKSNGTGPMSGSRMSITANG